MVNLKVALDILIANRRSIIADLLLCESYNTANDEIERSIFFLNTIGTQSTFTQGVEVDCTCVFLPLNQPLYSFFLQVFSVALVSNRVIFRPPEVLRGVYGKIHSCFKQSFDNIEIYYGTRNSFFRDCVENSEIVNFTGKYENALSIVKRLKPNQFMIFNGSALNPIVIDSDVSINLGLKAVIEASLYNSGQDCMAPGMIFLQDDIAKNFTASLDEMIKHIPVGDYTDFEVSIGPLISKDAFKEAVAFMNTNLDKIVVGGDYNEERMLISPTVFLYNDCLRINNYLFYAPFIIIYRFREISEIISYLQTPYAQTFKGYLSYYGEKNLSVFADDITLPFLLHNMTLLEYENSLKEFGGYGEGCSFIYYGGKIKAKPILILREIYEWKNNLF